MRTYLLLLFSLAAFALAQNPGTAVKTANKNWYLALYADDSTPGFINYVMCLYNSYTDAMDVIITKKKELYFEYYLFYFDIADGPDTTLGGFSARQFQYKSYDKKEEAAAVEKRHELKGDNNSTSGFSWTANKTLNFDYDGFYGWVKCDNFTVPHKGIAFKANNLYWAMEPIKDMPSYCEEVTLIQH